MPERKIPKICSAPDINLQVPLEYVQDALNRTNKDTKGSATAPFIVQAAKKMMQVGVLRFRIGVHNLGEDSSRTVAMAIAKDLSQALINIGHAPKDMRVEVDPIQASYVPAGFSTRTLLPHHDGGTRAYLTASQLDEPTVDPMKRGFVAGMAGKPGFEYEGSDNQKMYQGIFFVDVGTGFSLTSYYQMIPVLRRAYYHKYGREAPSIKALASFLNTNIERVWKMREQHSRLFPTLAGLLGSETLLYHALAPHHQEAPFAKEDYERYPELKNLECACKKCPADNGRLFCNALYEVLGMTLLEFRERFEFCIQSETHDFIIGNNIIYQHGGIGGSSNRTKHPINFVTNQTWGTEYEKWLADCWRMDEYIPN